MAKYQQKRSVSAPQIQDKTLAEFSSVVQENLSDLWELSHDHVPSASQQAAWSALTTDAQRIQFLAALLGFH